MHDTVTANHLWLIPALPLLGVVINATLGQRLGRGLVAIVAPGVVGIAFAVSLFTFASLLSLPSGTALTDTAFPWIHAGALQLDVGFRVDPLSAVMILVVTGVGFLIHVYSIGYMSHEPDVARYFTYLNLFTFAMLVLVLADSLPLLFVGWEGVGLCSYLLIGFWYDKEENANAGKKAFIVNRVGDAGFLLGTFLLFWNLGAGTHTFAFTELQAHVKDIPLGVVTAAALLLFVGATGKSAQLPLYVWLPDAMAGPTPVSALIHAATMVTAGVYMIARLNFLYVLTPTALTVVAWIGALTALFAATIGLAQNDIKKVLAYSTISQLGYMFLGVGVGAFSAGVFHLMTHAFFKALLFLGAGSVIHGMSGEQDMQKMGGLRKRMPITFGTFFIANLAIAGIPGFAGFFSKDEILLRAFTSENGSPALWVLGAIGAGLTAFYMYRLLFLTFYGECRADAEVAHHIHESPGAMTGPLVILAVLSIVGGWIGLPSHWLWGNRFEQFLAPVFGHQDAEHVSAALEYGLMATSVGIAVVGIAVAYFCYIVQPGMPMLIAWRAKGLYDLLFNKYYVDELYDAIVVQPIRRLSDKLWRSVDAGVIDGAVNGAAEAVSMAGGVWRRWQTGNVQHYALSFFVGAVVLIGYLAWR
ncbi:MAG TPA: NADH-quinone oxidoreductase subunit L [Candidatus Binatia bacterium]|nr:NADH-quinone oxidoreductase subunit L [Candidatus Binatia bacterium]